MCHMGNPKGHFGIKTAPEAVSTCSPANVRSFSAGERALSPTRFTCSQIPEECLEPKFPNPERLRPCRALDGDPAAGNGRPWAASAHADPGLFVRCQHAHVFRVALREPLV